MNTDELRQLWDRVATRLDQELPDWRDRIEGYAQVSALEARERAQRLDDEGFFFALVRAVLSNSTDWARVERVLPELRSLLKDFDSRWYANLTDEEVNAIVAWFQDRRAGSMTL